MLAAIVAQMIGDVGRFGQQLVHARLFAIEHAQRVLGQSLLVDGGQLAMVFAQISNQLLDVARLACRAAGAVELEGQPLEPQFPIEIHGQHHHFDVGRRIILAQDFAIDLAVLAQAPRLRPLASEAGADGVEFHRPRPTVHAVGDIGAHEPGGEFRPKRDAAAVTLLNGVHLFLDEEIRPLAHAAHEQFRRLKDGGVNVLKSIASRQAPGGSNNYVPVAAIIRQYVMHTR